MAYEVWDVTSVPAFPNQEDTKENTGRPAIIIEDLQSEVRLCPLTKQIHQETNYKYTIPINLNTPEAKQMGLTFDSIIILDRILTLKKVRLAGVVGTCPDSIVEKIEAMMGKMRSDGHDV